MNATDQQGHEWTGETEKEGSVTWWLYRDDKGQLYASKEMPAYRIDLRQCTQTMINGKMTITPIC